MRSVLLLFSLLLTSCSGLPAGAEKPPARVVNDTFTVWEENVSDVPQTCWEQRGEVRQLVVHQDEIGPLCFSENPDIVACFRFMDRSPLIVLLEGIEDSHPSLVRHETTHLLGLCALGDSDHDHSEPYWREHDLL